MIHIIVSIAVSHDFAEFLSCHEYFSTEANGKKEKNPMAKAAGSGAADNGSNGHSVPFCI